MTTTRENRAAIFSVRGYLYQFANVIQRLMTVDDARAVVHVESFDDIAIEALDGGRELIQVKYQARRFSLTSQKGLDLLEAWLKYDEPPYTTFTYVSTQAATGDFATLVDDDQRTRKELETKLRSISGGYPHLRSTLSDSNLFKNFWDRIRWRLDQDDLDEVIARLETIAREEFGEGGEARILPWLAAVAISATDLHEDQRRWTRARLLAVDGTSYQALIDALYGLREGELGQRATAKAASGREIDALLLATKVASRPSIRPSSTAFRGVAAAVLAAHRSFPLRHSGEHCVNDAAFSRDGSRVVTACFDKVIRVWDAHSHKLLFEHSGQNASILKLIVSPSGQFVAATIDDGSVALLNLHSNTPPKLLRDTLERHGRPHSVFFGLSELTLLTVQSGTATIWDVVSSNVLGTIGDGVQAACLSSQGRLFTLHKYGMLRVSDASNLSALGEVPQVVDNIAGIAVSANGQDLLSWNREKAWLRDDAGRVRADFLLPSVAAQGVFSPDGKTFLIVGRNGMARLYDTETKSLVSPLHGHQGQVRSGSFSSDGTAIVTAGDDGTARLFRTRDGFPYGLLEGHKKYVFAASFVPGGQQVLTASDDGDARLWAIPKDGLQNLRGHTKPIRLCVPSMSGSRMLTSCDDGSARLFNADTGALELLIDVSPDSFDACFVRDDTLIVTADYAGPAKVWGSRTGKQVKEFEPKASSLYVSPSGNLLAVVSDRQKLSLWDAESLTCVSRIDDLCETRIVHIECLAFSPCESSLVVGLSDGTLVRWNPLEPKPYVKWAANPGSNHLVKTVAFSPLGKCFVSAGHDKVARIWSSESNEPQGVCRGHADIITHTCFAPDGMTLLTTSRDASAILWDVESASEKMRLADHLDQIDTASFSPDGDYVLTGSMDLTARLWDLSDGHTIASFPHRGAVVDARFFCDGAKLVTASYMGDVQIHPASFDCYMRAARKLLADAGCEEM